MSYAHSLTEAQNMLTLWKECEKQLASGQAKAYRIGSREFTSVDLPEIVQRIGYYKNLIDQIKGEARHTRVARFVPRDL